MVNCFGYTNNEKNIIAKRFINELASFRDVLTEDRLDRLIAEVGNVHEKALAAARSGLTLWMPKDNLNESKDFSESLKENFVYIEFLEGLIREVEEEELINPEDIRSILMIKILRKQCSFF